MQRTIALYRYKLFNLFPFSVIEFCEVVMFKPWKQYVWSKSGSLFFFLATCATSFRIMPPYFTTWVNNILLRTPSMWFLRKGNPENQAQGDCLFFYLLLVASLRFSLVYLCIQFACDSPHFLVWWISRLIALWSKGVYIPSLHFLWPWTLTSFFFVIGKWRPLFL